MIWWFELLWNLLCLMVCLDPRALSAYYFSVSFVRVCVNLCVAVLSSMGSCY